MALPSQISYCKVTGRLLLALGDTNADVDKLPDGPGLDGATITITPAPSLIKVLAAKSLVIPKPIACTSDKSGYLIVKDTPVDEVTGLAAEADQGVMVVSSDDPDITPTGWTYIASIYRDDIVPFKIGPFAAPSGGEVDLSTVAEVSANPGEDVLLWQVAVNATGANVILAQQAVTEAQAARDAAEAARDEAVEAAAHPSDPAVAALIDDPDSEVRAALSSTYETQTSAAGRIASEVTRANAAYATTAQGAKADSAVQPTALTQAIAALSAAYVALSTPSRAMLAGRWYANSGPVGSGTVMTEAFEKAAPLIVGRSCVLDQLAVSCTVAGSTGALIRLGIRAHYPATALPGAVLVDAGTVAATSTGILSVTLGTPLSVTAGTLIWLTATAQGGATTKPTVRILASGPEVLGDSSAALVLDNALTGVQASGTAGALPATQTWSGTTTPPKVAVHVSA